MKDAPQGVALARLLQLASPALPVGAYSYSQGLEAAVEAGIVRDAASAERWIADVLAFSMARMEAPVLLRLCGAWNAGDAAAAGRWNALFIASRESAELRAESVQMGYSLTRLLGELDTDGGPAAWDEVSFPAAFAYAVARWNIDARDALVAYLWAWCENQVMAALKAVPLGRRQGRESSWRSAKAFPPLRQARAGSMTIRWATTRRDWRSSRRGTRHSTPGYSDPRSDR
jgi:urease accessory protein